MFWFNKNKTESSSENSLQAINNQWQALALSTETVNVQRITKSLKNVYKMLGYNEPNVVFYQSPYLIWNHILDLFFEDIPTDKIKQIEVFCKENLPKSKQGFLKDLVCQIISCLKKQPEEKLGISLKSQINNLFLEPLNISNSKKTQIQINDSHFELGLNQLNLQLESQLNNELLIKTLDKITAKINNVSIQKALTKIKLSLVENKSSQLLSSLGNLLGKSLFSRFCIPSEIWALEAIKIEYNEFRGESVISPQKWNLFKEIINNSGWILPYKNICFVGDKPQVINLNKKYLLHAEENLAIQFRDGNGFYAYEGVIIPSKYGKLSAENWESKWLLEEKNAELRRVLIQGLGYDRIAAELEAEEIDSWREYTILRFNKIIDDIDKQPVCLLKMICPSTNFIHALRIPPDFDSAREAIKWINWGVDPEEIILAS